ncbi:MAG: PAS-domain containing protein [Paracoccaceae bacterium]
MRDFTQTLTKTFAHLKVGLAIFDKQRQLTIFNPALTELTSLPIEFLLQRPTLHAFLDRLREKRMIPEQRNYISWRQRLFELETAAEDGTYEETWSLATGQTYRVTGNPHPDGALAFLIEDISAEISLTRRFRRELETSQAVIDSIDEAIAVFSPGGTLTISNVAYSRLWGEESCDTVAGSNILDATRTWGLKCSPTPVWGDARDFVALMGERLEWNAEVRLVDGRLLVCRFSPLAGGSTLAGFSINQNLPTRLVENKSSDLPPELEKIPG